MASRDPKDLDQDVRLKYFAFDAEMHRAGIDYILTCTYRSQAEQDALWAQGRTVPGKKVTWTRDSYHTKRRAFDIAILKDGKVSWNVKDYFEAARIGKAIGLTPGGEFRKPDYCHFQLS
jgi:peptidoglycan L-alanyl-D-glutamate endopeptidase CwlK